MIAPITLDKAQLTQQLHKLRAEERRAFGQLVFIQGRVAQLLEMLDRNNPDGESEAPSDSRGQSTDPALPKE